MIPESILIDRIKSSRPAVGEILDYSFPVTSFGDLNKARVLTVGINPSVDEFCSRKAGRPLLEPPKKRLVDAESIGVAPGSVLNEQQAQKVLQGNHDYFQSGNYYHWFDSLEKYALNPLGISYFDGSAAHVDLVQWATNPVWSKITDPAARQELVAESLPFLSRLFHEGEWDLVLLNGREVYRAFREYKVFQLQELEQHRVAGSLRDFRIGRVGKSPMLSWSVNLPVYGTSLSTREFVSEWVQDAAARTRLPDFTNWFASVSRD
jgi:hypothetical protein